MKVVVTAVGFKTRSSDITWPKDWPIPRVGDDVDIPNFPETIVSWQLERLDENKTKLILTHTGFTDKDKNEYDSHTEGWSWFMLRLQNYVTKEIIGR